MRTDTSNACSYSKCTDHSEIIPHLAKLFPAKAEEAYKINEEDAKRRLETYKKLAAEEFPQYDVNLRSAVSIARRVISAAPPER